MKKGMILCTSIMLLVLFSTVTYNANGQKPTDPMTPGTWTINFGIGPGISYYSGYSLGFGPGFQVAAERGMWQLGPGVLTLGGELGFSYFWWNHNYITYNYKYSWTTFVISPRSAYHYGWKVPGLDTYGGVAFGIRIVSFHATYPTGYPHEYMTYNPAAVGFFPGIFVGGSYFFNPQIGINAELGYNITWVQIGMVFKLN